MNGQAASVGEVPGAVVDDGLWGPGSVTWRVHLDPAFGIGGVRALMIQALHPRAMIAVAQHRGFSEDYWGRLDRTGEYLSTLTFGSTRDAHRAAARVRGIHGKLRSIEPGTSRTFRIDEPELLLWVHCTAAESFVTTVRRAGLALTDAEVDRYYAEQVLAAELLGLPADAVPSDAAGIADYYASIRPELRLIEEARYATLRLLVPPMKRWVQLATPARPAWAGMAGLAFALQPAWARKMYQMPGLGMTDAAATAAVKALRAAVGRVPERWTGPPATVAARRRFREFQAAGPAR